MEMARKIGKQIEKTKKFESKEVRAQLYNECSDIQVLFDGLNMDDGDEAMELDERVQAMIQQAFSRLGKIQDFFDPKPHRPRKDFVKALWNRKAEGYVDELRRIKEDLTAATVHQI